MSILSAKFIKGLVGPDEILDDGISQIAFIGRSNVGKSSLINALTNSKGLAKTSSFPGRTQQINIFLASASGGNKFYLIDLPGYGFAKASKDQQKEIQQLIYWYLLDSDYVQKKVVLIVDANVGATDTDLAMLHSLEERGKDIVIVANKADKLKKSEYTKKLEAIHGIAANIPVVACSSEKKTGIQELTQILFN